MKTLWIGVAALVLAGCGGVLSEHPASVEANRGDDRLIGFWLVDWEASGGTQEDAQKNQGLLAIGRRAGPEGGLELLTVTLEKDEVLVAERGQLRATTIGGRPYASLRSDTEEKEKQPADIWTIVRYDVPEDGVLRVFAMDEEAVGPDVRDGKIAGTATTPKPGALIAPVTVTLSASTQALRGYLETRGDGIFRTAHPLVLRRIAFR